ncbi:MAG: hypothetical protein U0791_08335 [Gemmataceae bacterium]
MCKRNLSGVIALVFVASVAPPARADEPHGAALPEKTAVLTGEWAAPARGTAPAFGMDLLLGQLTGIRPTFALPVNENSAVQIEGYYGGIFSKFGGSEGAGAGVRWVMSRGGADAVTIGPGVDVLFHFNDGQAVILAPTVDLAWRHSFGNRAALVLGINAGVGIGLSGRSHDDGGDPVSGRATPLISVYSGLRY